MKKRSVFILLMAILLSALSVSLMSCNEEYMDVVNSFIGKRETTEPPLVTYSWYDADGSILYEESIEEYRTPTSISLPEDTDKWDYTQWQTNSDGTEHYALRTPKSSYFVGNVFQIIAKDLGETPTTTGSAFVFNRDGWFITNAHVVEDAYYLTGVFNIPNSRTGESYTYLEIEGGSYYHLDKDIYIGKLKNYSSIVGYYQNITFEESYAVGDKTYSVGYPDSSSDLILGVGEITETWSDIYEKLYTGNSYVCSSSYIAPGSSGGVLVNEDLEVIGLTTLGWFDNYDRFVSGAAISVFNFKNLLQNTDPSQLVHCIDRFHSDEKAFVNFYNGCKTDDNFERFELDDGAIAYVYIWDNKNSTAGTNYVYEDTLIVCSDGYIIYEEDVYWTSGDRRTESFYGYFNSRDWLSDFSFKFKYDWGDGVYYTVECEDINYSENIALTLNKCTTSTSYGYNIGADNLEYAKETFNSTYKWLYEWIEKYNKE